MNAEKYINKSEVYQYKIINTDLIPFMQEVVDACRANRCGRYGTCWTCPPGVGDFRELEKKIKRYKYALVCSYKCELEDSFDFEGMMEGNRRARRDLRRMAEMMRKDGEEITVLGCEGCGLCEKCTYPDAPCRFPEKAIPSVEACGISVVELAKITGINYNNGANTVTYFTITLWEAGK